MIHLACPKCRAVLEVADNEANTLHRCRDCGAAVRMPSAGERVFGFFFILFFVVPAVLGVVAILAFALLHR